MHSFVQMAPLIYSWENGRENLLSKYIEEKFQYLISLGSLNFSKHCQKWDGKTNLVASLLSTKIQSPTVLITQLRT